jgi:nucleoid DNA-binding protein
MNKKELALAIAADTGLTKTIAYNVLTAMEQQLEGEGYAGRAVVWEQFGTFWPRKKMGKRTGHSLDGGSVTYDNWKLIPQPEVVDELSYTKLVAARADTKPPLVAMVLQSFKAQVLRTLRRGMGYYNHGHGSFQVAKQKIRTYHRDDGSISSQRPARKVVVYRGFKGGPHQKFVALPGLV